jgi:hypothetical protein
MNRGSAERIYRQQHYSICTLITQNEDAVERPKTYKKGDCSLDFNVSYDGAVPLWNPLLTFRYGYWRAPDVVHVGVAADRTTALPFSLFFARALLIFLFLVAVQVVTTPRKFVR